MSAEEERDFDKALAVIAPNEKRATRAVTSSHPLWHQIMTLRQGNTSWGGILKYARQRGCSLTADQSISA